MLAKLIVLSGRQQHAASQDFNKESSYAKR